MNRRKFLPQILVVTLLVGAVVACDKEDSFSPKGTYSLPTHFNVEPVCMFTVAGEVKDKTVINNFLNAPKGTFENELVYNLSTMFYLNSPTVPVDEDDYCNITFNQSQDMATINAKFMDLSTFGDTCNADIVRVNPLEIVSASVGNIYMEKPSNTSDYFHTGQVWKIKSFLGDQTTLDPVNPYRKIQLRANFPFIIGNNEVVIPVLIFFRWSNRPSGYLSAEWQRSWNVVNEDCFRNLSENDTILIQEGKAILRKQ